MSKSKPSRSEDPFATIPPREAFDAFPSLAAFPEDSIAFLTGKAPAAAPLQDAEPVRPVSRPAAQPASQPEPSPVRGRLRKRKKSYAKLGCSFSSRLSRLVTNASD